MDRTGQDQRRVLLMLQDAEGRPWPFSVRPGWERFIGRYPRLPGFAPQGSALLQYR